MVSSKSPASEHLQTTFTLLTCKFTSLRLVSTRSPVSLHLSYWFHLTHLQVYIFQTGFTPLTCKSTSFRLVSCHSPVNLHLSDWFHPVHLDEEFLHSLPAAQAVQIVYLHTLLPSVIYSERIS